MKLKGKVDFWFYLIILWFIYCSIDLIMEIETISVGTIFSSLTMILMTLFFLSFVLRNYILIKEDKAIIALSVFTTEITISEITSIENVTGFLKFASGYAVSFDRILIKYKKYGQIIIATKDKQGFAEKIKEINPNVQMKLVD